MRSLKEFISKDKEQLNYNDIELIDEAFIKTTSKAFAANKVRTLSGQIKKAKTEAEKLDLIASQNAWLAGLVLLNNGLN